MLITASGISVPKISWSNRLFITTTSHDANMTTSPIANHNKQSTPSMTCRTRNGMRERNVVNDKCVPAFIPLAIANHDNHTNAPMATSGPHAACAESIGIDIVHWGVVFVVGTTIGFVTPPYGLNLFVVSGVLKIPYDQIVRQIFKLLIPLMIVWMIVTWVPSLSLVLLDGN